MSKKTVTYKINQHKQLIDLNGKSINFNLNFNVVSKNSEPFEILVIDQTTLDSNINLEYQKSDEGNISGNVVCDKNIYENYFLVIKAEKECDVQVTIDKKEIQFQPQQLQPQQLQQQQFQQQQFQEQQFQQQQFQPQQFQPQQLQPQQLQPQQLQPQQLQPQQLQSQQQIQDQHSDQFQTQNKIQYFSKKENISGKDTNWKFIIFFIILILFLGAGYYFYNKNKNKIKNETKMLDNYEINSILTKPAILSSTQDISSTLIPNINQNSILNDNISNIKPLESTPNIYNSELLDRLNKLKI